MWKWISLSAAWTGALLVPWTALFSLDAFAGLTVFAGVCLGTVTWLLAEVLQSRSGREGDTDAPKAVANDRKG
jgi:hypothetical protein